MKLVLICDDQSTIAEVAAEIIKLLGYNTIVLDNCINIEQMCAEKNPDLILLDMRMPVRSGVSATRELKNNPNTSNIPVIAFSAEQEYIDQAIKNGADDYINKPFDLSEIESKLEKYLGKPLKM